MLEWLSANAFIREHWGDLASVVGLLITFGGFALTFYKIRNTRRIAEETRNRLEQNLCIADISEATAVAREIKRLQRENVSWKVIIDRYSHLADILLEVETTAGELSVKALRRIRNVMKRCAELEQMIEKGLRKGLKQEMLVEGRFPDSAPDVDVSVLNAEVSAMITELGHVASEIKTIR